MDQINPFSLLLALAIAMVGGTIKGAIAFGFPLFTVPLLAAVLGPKVAVVVVILPVLITNAVVLISRRGSPGIPRRFGLMSLAFAPATVAGSLLLASIDARLLAIGVGSLALAFAALSAFRVQLVVPPRLEARLGPVMGVAGGLLHGLSGISGPLVAVYVDALRLTPRDFTYGVTLLFTVGGIVQGLAFAQLGLFTPSTFVTSLLLAPVGIIGQQIGFRLQDRLNPRRFRQIVLGFVAFSGVNLLLRGLGLT